MFAMNDERNEKSVFLTVVCVFVPMMETHTHIPYLLLSIIFLRKLKKMFSDQ